MFDFSLPKEAGLVQGQLTWIKELLPSLESSATENVLTIEEYLHRVLKEDEISKRNEFGMGSDFHGWEDSLDEVDGEAVIATEDCHSAYGVMANLLNIVAFHTYLENFQEAGKLLREVRKTVAFSSESEKLKMKEGHLDAIWYCINAAEYQIKVFAHHRKPIQVEEVAEELEEPEPKPMPVNIISDGEKLSNEWNESMKRNPKVDERKQQFKATVQFFKGCLGAALRIKHEEILNKFKQAITFERKFYAWHHFAYQRSRILRRGCFKRGQKFMGPGKEEKLHCINAFRLAPNELLTQLDRALLLKEEIWYESQYVWNECENQIRDCIQFFEKVLDNAKKSTRKDKNRWIVLTSMYYSEFLLFGKHDTLLDKDKGKKMLEECLEEFPNSSTILHKVAKMYNRIEKFKDVEKAMDRFVRALKSAPNNYPCIMDYLKLLKAEKRYQKAIEIIDDALKTLVRDSHRANLYIERGYLVWLYNPGQKRTHKRIACQAWIYVLVNYPECSMEVYNLFKQPHFKSSAANRLYDCKLQVVEELQGLKGISGKPEELQAIRNFIRILKMRNPDLNSLFWEWDGNKSLVITNSNIADSVSTMRVSSRNLFGKSKNLEVNMLINDPGRFYREKPKIKQGRWAAFQKTPIQINPLVSKIKIPTKRQRKTSLNGKGEDWVAKYID